MKKLFSIFIVLCLLTNTVYGANSINMQTDSLNVTSNEEFTVTMQIKDFEEIETGINVIKGKLEYDSNMLEEIQSENFIMKNSWKDLIYNQDTKEFIAISAVDVMQESDVFDLRIKVKSNVDNTKIHISLTECQVSEGKQDINIPDCNIELKIKKDDTDNNIDIKPDNDTKNDNIDNNTDNNVATKPDNNIKNDNNKNNTINNPNVEKLPDEHLPKTGKDSYWWLFALIVLFTIIAIFTYKKSRLNNMFLILLVGIIISGNTVKAANICDINNDGLLNSIDITLMQKYLIHLDTFNESQIEIADINKDNTISVTDLSLLLKLSKEETSKNVYLIQLDRFNIRNDGVTSESNSTGITEAFKYAESEGYKKVLFPQGTYSIKAPTPIIIDNSNLVIDLNGSTIKMQDEQYEDKWVVVQIKETSKNITLTNGTMQGNRFSKYFDYSNSKNEWTNLLSLTGDNITIDNILFKDAPGYGIGTMSGNSPTERIALYPKHFENGDIQDDGTLVNDSTKMRNNTFYDITKFGDKFELGYTLGYQAFPYIKSKAYIACFYDENEKFILRKECSQFIKTDIPQNAKYVKFVINQSEVGTPTTALAWVSNVKGLRNSTVKNCTFEHNATLAIAVCGGQNVLYEGNKFIENGTEIDGNKARSPAAAIDLEDGWELMQNTTFRNNTFKGNRADLISCAGDGLIVEDNYFDGGITIYKRTTNYIIRNNTIENETNHVTLYESSKGGKIYNNTYKNTRIRVYNTEWKSGPNDVPNVAATIENEKFIDTEIRTSPVTNTVVIEKQVIKNSYITGYHKGTPFLVGNYENCTFENFEGYDSATVSDSNIINSKMQFNGDAIFTNCIIKNSNIMTHSNPNITGYSVIIDNCQIDDSPILTNTWAKPPVSITIKNSILNNTKPDESILKLSAGKAKDIIVIGNTITSKSNVINIFDTNYTTPDGKLLVENNEVDIPDDAYLVTGKKVKSGNYSITLKNNELNRGTLINPIYTNSEYLTVKYNHA